MDDWQIFVDSVPWFLDANADVRISSPREDIQLPPSTAKAFPLLANLIARSRVTPVSVNDVSYQLLAWNADGGYRFGWLCCSQVGDSLTHVFPEHARLLRSFGGILERFNEPEDTWLLNHNEALTAREAVHDASFIDHYRCAFTEAGIDVPIRLTDYYSVAREANGNTTLCHRTTGKILLFAPDHSFDFVTPFDACPEYTLYEINGVVDFHDWVEAVAQQWLNHVAKAT